MGNRTTLYPYISDEGEKQNTYKMSWKVHPDWSWSHTDYFLEINHPKRKLRP